MGGIFIIHELNHASPEYFSDNVNDVFGFKASDFEGLISSTADDVKSEQQSFHLPRVRLDLERDSSMWETSTVYVTSGADTVADADECASVSSDFCTLRSAFAYCTTGISASAFQSCVINFVRPLTVMLNSSLGDIFVDVSATEGSITVNGNNSVVMSDGCGVGRMLSLNTRSVGGVSLHISDMIIENFGHYKFEGGAVYMTDASSSTFRNVVFRNNSAYRGGSLYMSYSDDVLFDNCTFEGGSADEGSAVYLHQFNSRGRISKCVFNSSRGESRGMCVMYIVSFIIGDYFLLRGFINRTRKRGLGNRR